MSERKTTATTAVDTLFYDGACPLCRREIKKLSVLSDGKMRFIDLHEVQLCSVYPDREQLMQKLHLRTDSGEWLVGIDANIYAWRHTRYAWVWNILRCPFIYPLASRAYNFWALVRYQKIAKTPYET